MDSQIKKNVYLINIYDYEINKYGEWIGDKKLSTQVVVGKEQLDAILNIYPRSIYKCIENNGEENYTKFMVEAKNNEN